jgi:hypothetical protein
MRPYSLPLNHISDIKTNITKKEDSLQEHILDLALKLQPSKHTLMLQILEWTNYNTKVSPIQTSIR